MAAWFPNAPHITDALCGETAEMDSLHNAPVMMNIHVFLIVSLYKLF